MNFIALIFTAFALSMDAFAVSITKGMTIKNGFSIWSISRGDATSWMGFRYKL